MTKYILEEIFQLFSFSSFFLFYSYSRFYSCSYCIRMKVTPNSSTTSTTNRVSALKRLSKPVPINKNNHSSNIHHRLSAPTTAPIITDARELLTSRNKPIFDARQLLSRQSSNIRKDIEPTEEDEEKMIVTKRFQQSRVS
jgi:hypothetical protein